MNPKVLPGEAWQVVRLLQAGGLLKPWILAGGTGLALQLGHRVSVDLDFFREEPFEVPKLRSSLAAIGTLVVQSQAEHTLHVLLDDVRLSYLRSEVPFLYEPTTYRGLMLADARDIAAMKIIAVAGRGSRKDFVDLYSYLEAGGSFPALMEIVRRRYAGVTFSEVHLLRSLVYFEDAEGEPMPHMLRNVDWKQVRNRLEAEARRWAPG